MPRFEAWQEIISGGETVDGLTLPFSCADSNGNANVVSPVYDEGGTLLDAAIGSAIVPVTSKCKVDNIAVSGGTASGPRRRQGPFIDVLRRGRGIHPLRRSANRKRIGFSPAPSCG